MLDDIKTYAHVHPDDRWLTFDIKDIGVIYDKSNGKPDKPHRHDYYTVILVKKSKGVHKVDFNSYEFGQNQVWFVSPGQVHQVIEKVRPEGWVMTFSRSFLMENGIDHCFISDINLFNDYGSAPPLEVTSDEFSVLNSYCLSMRSSLQNGSSFTYQEIGALLKLFLIQCHNSCSLSQVTNTQLVEAGTGILRDYKNLVEDHYKEHHQVSFYSDALSVSPDHLNKTVKSLIDKTAKEYLQNRLAIAAKRMLQFTDLSIKEIAYSLGFSEPSHFSRFFKNCTGISPVKFREKALKSEALPHD